MQLKVRSLLRIPAQGLLMRTVIDYLNHFTQRKIRGRAWVWPMFTRMLKRIRGGFTLNLEVSVARGLLLNCQNNAGLLLHLSSKKNGCGLGARGWNLQTV